MITAKEVEESVTPEKIEQIKKMQHLRNEADKHKEVIMSPTELRQIMDKHGLNDLLDDTTNPDPAREMIENAIKEAFISGALSGGMDSNVFNEALQYFG